jgi:hypothetical protein
MAGLFGGKGGGGGGGRSTTSYYTPQFYQPYEDYENNVLGKVNYLTNQAMNGMPQYTGEQVAPINATQNQAFGQVQNLQGSYQPYYNNANAQLGNVAGMNAPNAAASYFASAYGTPSALTSASPYATTAAGGFNNAGTVNSYMSPYINSAVNASNKLQTTNFLNNVMPGLNSQFIGSGGGLLGSNNAYKNAVNTALTNFNQNLAASTNNMLNQGYGLASQNFQSDAARNAQLAGTMGNLALGQQQGYGNLGTSVGNLNLGQQGASTNLANAYGTLGTGQLNAGLLASNALLQTGNQQQQNKQAQDTASYNNYLQNLQWPYQVLGWGANTVNSFQWPNGYTQSSNTTSPDNTLGNILGGALSIGSLAVPGAGGSSFFGNLFSGLGGASGGGAGLSNLAGQIGLGGQAGVNAASLPFLMGAFKRGGFFANDDASMPPRDYAANTFDRRGFFSGGIDGASEPVYTQLPNNDYADGGGVDPQAQRDAMARQQYEALLRAGQGTGARFQFADQLSRPSDYAVWQGAAHPFVGGYADGGFFADGGDVDPIIGALSRMNGMRPLEGSDSAIARALADKRLDEDLNSARDIMDSNRPMYVTPTPFDPPPEDVLQFDHGGFFANDNASMPPFFEWHDGYYNTGGYVPTIKAANAYYTNKVKGYRKEQAEEEATQQANAHKLPFAKGGSAAIVPVDVHKHENLMHPDQAHTPIDGSGFFTDSRAIAGVHKHESHDHPGKPKTKIKLPSKGSPKKRMAKAIWAHDHHMHPGKSRTPLGVR